MEKVQGLPYRGKDGPTMQFWPAHQHDFFQAQTCNLMTQNGHLDPRSTFNTADDMTTSHQSPLPWHLTQVDYRDGSVSGVRNWSQNWEWDSLALTAQATSSGTKRGPYSQIGGRESDFSSPSPPENYEENGMHKEPTLYEFGLNSRTRAHEDDGLLDLKLGGNVHVPGAGEVSPSSKRSRHSPSENQQTRCQVDNCSEDLQNAKDYHRRHKVCEIHAKSPKALVNTLMQRFCQQCSRFHLLKEFDDDRRSCRKRLAGHNRRRRKTQPDAATALACLLADQSVLSRIISPSGQQQGKDELEKLLQEQTLVQTLLNARAAVGNAESKRLECAPQNNLLNAVSKSQLLSNLLLSNANIGCNLAVTPAPAEALISALSTALLSSLPQLQKVNADVGHGASVPIQETVQSHEPYVNSVGSHIVTKQNGNGYSRFSSEEQPGPLTFSKERPPVLPTTPPVYTDKSNSSNGDSLDERLLSDTYQRCTQEGFIQQDRRHWISQNNEAAFVNSTGNLRAAGALQTRERCLPPDTHTSPQGDQFETIGGLSDHSSDTSLDKQEQTGSLWFKIFDKNPEDIPSSMRSKILKWLDHRPSELEGHIKPGCIILTIFVCMPVHAWEKLCKNINKSLQRLISISDDDFWSKGRVLAYFGEASAFIVDGKVYPNLNHRPMQVPRLALVQPFAAVMGERVDLTIRGQHLSSPGTKLVCAFQGKCTIKGIDLSTNVKEKKRDREETSVASSDATQDQAITFTVGPFHSIGRGFIEVEGQIWRGTAFPIIIAEKPICQEISSLEKKYVESGDKYSARASSSTLEADIIHFLHELGWLLQRVQRKDHYLHLEMPEFSIERYRWLLLFAVEHSCCAVVRWILDLLFSAHDSSLQQAHSRALEVLMEANLLHVAVKSKARDMVKFLVAYSPPVEATSTDSKREYFFRPDSPICDGFTPLHVAAGMQSAESVVDALTDAPAEIWALAWTSAKDAFGQTPVMYAVSSGNDEYVKMVQGKLLKLGNENGSSKVGSIAKPPHLALNISNENAFASSPRKSLPTKQVQACSCRVREAQLAHALPLRIRGLNKGFMYRPLVLSMLAVAAVCVCVGVLMRGSPYVNYMQGPFVWESISFGSI
ncbi:hypothetical protein GOP47_0011555 [Adiantum capillus-veneris]|uniref:SBP-type domain-containing protein n=1 Tax=Adiantum capillus-veneris TaxID=13818 RepID=A0A9D4UU96_ADICA|nr:hypothetical protein GOP47_0011555 [Adiantum capillus-veneris]